MKKAKRRFWIALGALEARMLVVAVWAGGYIIRTEGSPEFPVVWTGRCLEDEV